MNTKMYVGNLPFSAGDADLRQLFSDYGTITDLFLPMDHGTNRPRGFAFVTMDSAMGMQEAIKALHDTDFMGRNLTVNEARPKEARPAYNGGGRGGYGGGGGRRERY